MSVLAPNNRGKTESATRYERRIVRVSDTYNRETMLQGARKPLYKNTQDLM